MGRTLLRYLQVSRAAYGPEAEYSSRERARLWRFYFNFRKCCRTHVSLRGCRLHQGAVFILWEFRHWDLSVYWQSARQRKSGNPAQLSASIWSLGIFVKWFRERAEEAGIISLGAEEIKLLKSYTRLYKEKFGFPLVICALLNNKETILERIRERLNNDSYQELNIGIKEVKDIMVLRVKDLVNSETSKI